MKIGAKFTEEHKKKLSEAKKGKIGVRRGYKKGNDQVCLFCNKVYYKAPSEKSKFCSYLCAMELRKGVKRNPEIGLKISKSKKGIPHYNQRGEKNGLWKGGITPINSAIRNSLEYKLWRESVFKRDDYTCIWCGFVSKRVNPSDIHADHIQTFANYPELRFAIDNGRTLCVNCHKKRHNNLK